MLGNAPFAVQEVADMELDDGVERMEPYIQNVRYVHFEAAKIKECLDDWRKDEVQRRIAEEALLAPILKAREATRQVLVRRAFAAALCVLQPGHNRDDTLVLLDSPSPAAGSQEASTAKSKQGGWTGAECVMPGCP